MLLGSRCLLVLGLFTLAVQAEEPCSEGFFAQVARQEGEAFSVSRGLLERRGEALIPFLRKKSAAAEWQERDLAGDLLLRIEKPAETLLLTEALTFPHDLAPADEHTVAVTFDPAAWGNNRRPKEEPPAEKSFTIRRDHVPFILGMLRGELGNRSSTRSLMCERGLSILKHLAAPESVPALVYLAGFDRNISSDSPYVTALVAVGAPAAPVLREFVRQTPNTWPEWSNDNVQERERYHHTLMSACNAALALAKLGDREAIPELAGKLDGATFGRQIEVYGLALGQLKAVDVVPVVFAQLVRTLDRHRDKARSSDKPEYGRVRQAMLAYGDAATDFLKTRLAPACSLSERVIATGLMAELKEAERYRQFYLGAAKVIAAEETPGLRSAPKKDVATQLEFGREGFWTGWYPCYGEPTPPALLVERAYLLGKLKDLVSVSRLKDQSLAFDIVAAAVLRPPLYRREERASLTMAFAEMGDARAVDVLIERLAQQDLRERETDVEALLLLDNPKAIPALEELIRRHDEKEANPRRRLPPEFSGEAAVDLARAVILVLKGDREGLLKLLDSPLPSVRLSAARVLARKGEAKSLDVLLPAALAVKGEEHLDLRDAIVRLGAAALETLDRRLKNATDPREKLLCESLALRIRNPELVKRMELARVDASGFGMHAGPSVGTYQSVGRQYAEAAGREALPLFEAALAFEAGVFRPGVALFAIASFKEERSIPVIVASASTPLRASHGEPLVPIALSEFGEKGIEAAKNVPAPVSGRPAFGNRASRHEAATEALALVKDIKGVENVLEGLREPRPEDRKEFYAWLRRMGAYLKAALGYHDPRIVDAVLPLLDQKDIDRLWESAVAVLAEYDDPRVVPACMRFLPTDETYSTANPAVAALFKRLGDGIGPFLVKALQEEGSATRTGAARALGNLFDNAGSYCGRTEEGEAAAKKMSEAIRACSVGSLTTALQDRIQSVRAAAAGALAQMLPDRTGAPDPLVVKPLAEWIRSERDPHFSVVEALAASTDPVVADALLASYELNGRHSIGLASAVARTAGAKGIKAISDAIRNRIEKDDLRYGIPEFTSLVESGPAGAAQVLDFFRESRDMRVRLQAITAMGAACYKDGFKDTRKYCDELIAVGPWNRELDCVSSESHGRSYSTILWNVTHALLQMDPMHAYPYLCGVMLKIEEKDLVKQLGARLQMLEREHPELKELEIPHEKTVALPSLPAQELPRIRFLEVCDLWNETAQRQGSTIPEDIRMKLLAAGDAALDTLVELCYPPAQLEDRNVVDAIAALGRDETRAAAVSLLGLRGYSAAVFDRALAEAKPPALGYALAIRKWRERGPWPLRKHDDLLATGTAMLEGYWPLEGLRAYAKAHLDRLARVDKVPHGWGVRPISPLLASLRYSDDPAERELLISFAKDAAPGAAGVARDVMRDGLVGRYGGPLAPHWKKLPPHDYRPK